MSEAGASGRMAARAAAPVVGVVLLTVAAVVAATTVGTAIVVDPPDRGPTAAFDVEADASGAISVTHAGGDPVDPDELRVRVRVDGEPLAAQPPVPFFAASGFAGGPTGPFNSAAEGEWHPGETATLRVADTNTPTPTEGASVEVRLYVAEDRIALVGTTVRARRN